LDAVIEAVASMEDDPVFNAGTGSTLNLAGAIEADASVMDGDSLRGAGVALVRGVKNPVKLARVVMEHTDHALIAGRSAGQIARAFDLPKGNLKVRSRMDTWRREKALFNKGRLGNLGKNYKLIHKEGLARMLDTVGAVAVDKHGDLAAACSTGGLSLKIPGRIGDSAILGAGLYADNDVGAATATGIGEIAIRLAISKTACDLMSELSAGRAASEAIRMVSRRVGKGLGIITLDKKGRHGVAHNTQHLCWAVADDERVAERLYGLRL
jgi:beta-aspartyl-peptidase (threonine type)